MAAPNFTTRVWIAFDPPSSTSPTWVEITSFVQQDSPINITHGRSDGLSDVNASTCSLTVDDSDGRFQPANPAGTWFGQIHKGNWLKVELTPPSGTVSSRFVGFITSLPNTWSGQAQYGQITASDRFEKLQQNPAIVSSVQSEVLTDPNLAGLIKGYWNLHEPQDVLSFGDTSGQGATYLKAIGFGGVPAGTGFAASNADSPGFDGLRCPTFNPISASQGTYLQAPITSPPASWDFPNETYNATARPTLELWFQATTTGQDQVLASLADPAGAQFAFSLFIDGASGGLGIAAISIAQNNPWTASVGTYGGVVIDDGLWHHVIWAPAAIVNAGQLYKDMVVIIDGTNLNTVGTRNGAVGNPTASSNFTQLTIGGAYDHTTPGNFLVGASNISDVSYYWGNISYDFGTPAPMPNSIDHFAAGTTGFFGESTDLRIARVARYAGVPVPLHSVTPALEDSATNYTVQVYNPIQGPWTNLATAAHLCGTQSMAGRKPLDIMLEAAHTEEMPLYVNRSGYLEIQPSTTRQNASPAWSVNALDLDPSTQVADDFAYTTNQMTITPNGLAAQTVIGGTGSAGQSSQAKFGIYDGSQATASANPIEAQSLGLGIIQLRADPAPRLAPLAIEAATLARLPGYGNAWYDAVLATEISTLAGVTSAPAAVGGGTYDALVEGWTEAITAGNHLIQFNVSPVQGPTYQLDDALLGRLDTDGTTLVGALNTTATTFTAAITSTTSAAWTTSAADFPFDILMGTEQMTVTAVAPVAMGVDGTFETGASGWTLTSCTLAQSSAQAHSGTHSGLMTSTVIGTVAASTPQFAVFAGATYQLGLWFLLGTGAPDSVFATVTWFTSGGTLISSIANTYFLTPQSFWRTNASAVTAPSNAAFGQVLIRWTAAAIGNSVYLDDVLFPLLTGGQQQFTVTRAVNGVHASHTTGAALALAEPLTLAY